MIDFSYYYFRVLRRLLNSKLPAHTVYGNRIIDIEEGSIEIQRCIQRGKPCMIGRIGSVEMQAINAAISVKMGLKKHIPEENINYLYNNAGFFPKEEAKIFEFADLYREACSSLDLAAVLMNRDEDYFYHKYAKNIKYLRLATLEPYYSKDPWTKILKGKKVLVIHPFSESIARQYEENRTKLFDNKDILPEFDLIVLKAVQTIGDNTEGYSSWFEALEDMESKVDMINYDIALLGCGAYAFPLASYIKKRGKQAVILGGATQLLFGIKGRRWDSIELVSRLYNDYWIRPNETERPDGLTKVENGCYW